MDIQEVPDPVSSAVLIVKPRLLELAPGEQVEFLASDGLPCRPPRPLHPKISDQDPGINLFVLGGGSADHPAAGHIRGAGEVLAAGVQQEHRVELQLGLGRALGLVVDYCPVAAARHYRLEGEGHAPWACQSLGVDLLCEITFAHFLASQQFLLQPPEGLDQGHPIFQATFPEPLNLIFIFDASSVFDSIPIHPILHSLRKSQGARRPYCDLLRVDAF
jgi:hypothetical protein